MTDLPKVHPREAVVHAAETAIRLAVAGACEPLTAAEALAVINTVLGDEIARIAKHAIWAERGTKR